MLENHFAYRRPAPYRCLLGNGSDIERTALGVGECHEKKRQAETDDERPHFVHG